MKEIFYDSQLAPAKFNTWGVRRGGGGGGANGQLLITNTVNILDKREQAVNRYFVHIISLVIDNNPS